jgi:uncharacterized protein (TIGR02118 family)
MIALVGTWRIPAGDEAARFTDRYHNDHVPVVRSLPGLRRHVVGRADGGPGYERWTAQLWFAHLAALRGAESSAEWRAVSATGVMSQAHDLEMTIYELDDWYPAPGPETAA